MLLMVIGEDESGGSLGGVTEGGIGTDLVVPVAGVGGIGVTGWAGWPIGVGVGSFGGECGGHGYLTGVVGFEGVPATKDGSALTMAGFEVEQDTLGSSITTPASGH